MIGTSDGSAPPFYYLAELWFDDPEQLQAGMGSPEGQAAGAGSSGAGAAEQASVAVLRMALDQERSLVNILA